MSKPLDRLLRRACVILDTERVLALIPPRVENVGGLVKSAEFRRVAARGLLGAELNQVAELDELPIWQVLDQEMAMSAPKILQPVWQARHELYGWLCEQGRVRASCPHCAVATELDLAFYVLAMHLAPWRLFDDQGLLDALNLSDPEPTMPPSYQLPQASVAVTRRALASRPAGLDRASELQVAMPSARVGLGVASDIATVELGTLEPAAEARAWSQFAPPGMPQPEGRAWWRWEDPLFRATLRAAAAMKRVGRADGTTGTATPADVEGLFLCDLHFFDIVYHATHDLPVPANGGRALIHCKCGGTFLPVC